jgi:hypothetical protein
MNLDLAILNALKRTPVQEVSHSVLSNYGQQYEIHAVHNDLSKGHSMTGTKIAEASNNGTIRAAVVENQKIGLSANEFGRVWTPTVETMIPISAPLTKEGPLGHFTSLPIGNNTPMLTQNTTAQMGGSI